MSARAGSATAWGAGETHAGGWTEERTAQLRQLWGEGLSASQIAAILGGGLTRSGVLGKVHRLRINHRDKEQPAGPAPRQRSRVPSAPRRPAVAVKPRVRAGTPASSAPPLSAKAPTSRPAGPAPGPQASPFVSRAEAWRPVPESVPVGLLELGPGTCRWPLGELPQEGGSASPPAPRPQLFCGAAPIEGKPYCGAHAALARGADQ